MSSGSSKNTQAVPKQRMQETLTAQRSHTVCLLGTFLQALEPDVNYASLDLSKAKKPKKKRHPKQAQGCNNLPAHLTPLDSFSEVDVDVEAQLPPGDTSPLLSHSSVYLNTQQIAKETEDMGRGRSAKTEAEGSKWMNRDRDGEEGKHRWEGSNGDICTEAAEAGGCHGDTDAFNGV